jgi:CRISPR-associated protein Csm5
MKLQIKTLSPIHIGSGEKYNGLAYIQDKRQRPFKLWFLEFDKIKQVLNSQQLQNLAEWIMSERYPTIQKFLQHKLSDTNNNITNKLISAAIYKIDLLFEENHQQGRFLKDIEAFIKQNNSVFIPGSEIKGAIRTAVLYKLLKENSDNWNFLKEELESFKNKFSQTFQIISSGNKKANYELTQEEIKRIPNHEKQALFGEKIPRRIKISDIKKVLSKKMEKIEEKLQEKVFRTQNNNDAKYDLLKLLSISDSDSKKPDDCLFVSNLETLNINRQFQIFQELLKPGQVFTCEIKLNNDSLLIDKLGFSEHQKNVISSIGNIFKCCYEFTNKLIEEEINYFTTYKQEIVNKLENIKKQNQENSPVIRIGKNEGYLSLTIALLIKEKDPDLYKNVVIHTTKNTSYTNLFPKTRRIVNIGNNNLDTLGWVKLNLQKE